MPLTIEICTIDFPLFFQNDIFWSFAAMRFIFCQQKDILNTERNAMSILGGLSMRKLLFAALIICLLSLIGCSKDESSPNDLMKEYVDLWNESEFEDRKSVV